MQYDYVGAYGGHQDLKAQLNTFFGSDSDKNLFIYHNETDELYKDFQSYFKFIPAAGGLVRNEKGDNLVIFRRGKWFPATGMTTRFSRRSDIRLAPTLTVSRRNIRSC